MDIKDLDSQSESLSQVYSEDLNNNSQTTRSSPLSMPTKNSADNWSGVETPLLAKSLFTRRLLFSLLAGGLIALLLLVSLSYFVVREVELNRIESHYAGLITLASSTNVHAFKTSMDLLLENGSELEFPLKGYIVYTDGYGSNPVLRGGDTRSLGRIPNTNPASSRYFQTSEHYDTAIETALFQNLRPDSVPSNPRSIDPHSMVVHVRADARQIEKYLDAYLVRATLLSVLAVVLGIVLFALILSRYLRRSILELLESRKPILNRENNPAASESIKSEHTILTEILCNLEQGKSAIQDPLIDSADLLASERLAHFASIGEHLLWESDSRLRLTHVAGDENLLWNSRAYGLTQNRHSLEAALASKGVEKNTFRQVVDSLHNTSQWQGNLISSHNEETRIFRIAAEKIPDKSQASGYRGFLIDTTEADAVREKLQREVRLDDLTGVANRRGFLTDIQKALDSCVTTGARHSVCMLDLDRFKQVNDTCGHAAGDMLLVHIADILKHEVRVSDIVARLGGDEFALLLENCPVERAAAVAENVRKKIADYRFNWNGQSHSVGISIGVVEISNEFSNPKIILVAADACCYRAKRSGRDQVQLHNADDELLLAQQAEVEASNRIIEALEEDRIELVCQAVKAVGSENKDFSTQGDSKAGEKIFYEISSQLLERDNSYSPESEFLPDAERFNLIAQVDLYIFKQALIWLSAKIQEQGDWISPKHIQISVNVSALSLQDPVYQQGLLNLLENSAVDNSFICIEIEEAFLLKKLETVFCFLQMLGKLGCNIILDKMTNGVSVLAAVSELSVSHAKLDQKMTHGISADPLRQMMLRTVEDLTDHFNIQLVALGIDKASQWDELKGQRIALVQGALVGQPKSLEHTSSDISAELMMLENIIKKAA